MFRRREKDALIVGAGPIGLCTAVSLATAGLEPKIIERHWSHELREGSVILYAQSLGLLDELGVGDDVLAEATRVDQLSIYDRDGIRHALLDMKGVDPHHPYCALVPLETLVEVLVEALRELDIDIDWHHRLSELRQSEDGRLFAAVERLERESMGYGVAHVEEVVERTEKIVAHYVVGADGEGSTVHRYLTGETEHLAGDGIMLAFETAPAHPRAEAFLVVGDEGIMTVFPLPSDRMLWSFSRHDGQLSRDLLDVDGLARLVRSRAPWLSARLGTLEWASAFPYRNDVVRATPNERVWLTGAAAHTGSPLMSYLLNAGMAEGHDLAQHMARVAHGEASVGDLTRARDAHLEEIRERLAPQTVFAAGPDAEPWLRRNAGAIADALPACGLARDHLAAELGLHRVPAHRVVSTFAPPSPGSRL